MSAVFNVIRLPAEVSMPMSGEEFQSSGVLPTREERTRTEVLAKLWLGFTGMNLSTPRYGPAI